MNTSVYILIIASIVCGMESIPSRHRRQFDWANSSGDLDDDQNTSNNLQSPGNNWNDDGSTWNRPQSQQQQIDNTRPEVIAESTTPAASRSTTTRAPASFTRCLSNCMTTQEYNPVCGTDGNTYNNNGRLRCAAACGANVQFARGGTCQPL